MKVDPTILPTDEEVAGFQSRGWYVSRTFLDEDLLADAAFGAQRYHAGERDRRLPHAAGFLDWHPGDPDLLRLNDYTSLQNHELGRLVRVPALAAIAARLLGVRQIRLFHDQLVSKLPDPAGSHTRVGWHVDRAYWKTCSSLDMITAWIPFEACTPQVGPLMVLDGSHLWADNDDLDTFRDQDLEGLVGKLSTHGHPLNVQTMLLRRGQVSFHHARTIHGSDANRSSSERTVLAVHFQSGENRYRQHRDRSGRLTAHVNDLLCRTDAAGDPDYTDPDICPVLWEEP